MIPPPGASYPLCCAADTPRGDTHQPRLPETHAMKLHALTAAFRDAIDGARALSDARNAQRHLASSLPRVQVPDRRNPDPNDPGPPPKLPDHNQVMDEAKQRALRAAALVGGVAAAKEAVDLYRAHQQGDPVDRTIIWASAKRVGAQAFASANYASKRYLFVSGLDSAARLVAWQTAHRASRSTAARALHFVSSRLVGRASIAFTAAETFIVTARDIRRFNQGELSRQDFYRNCALTGVSIAAPLAGGALGGPLGATVGSVVSVGAIMHRK